MPPSEEIYILACRSLHSLLCKPKQRIMYQTYKNIKINTHAPARTHTHTHTHIHIKTYMYVVGYKSFRPDQLFKVMEIKQLCYFSTQSPFVSTHFSTDTLTSPQMALYTPHSIFHLARLCMSGRKLLDPTMYVSTNTTYCMCVR